MHLVLYSPLGCLQFLTCLVSLDVRIAREIFEEMDTNEDEHLDEDELVQALKNIWEHMDVKVARRIQA